MKEQGIQVESKCQEQLFDASPLLCAGLGHGVRESGLGAAVATGQQRGLGARPPSGWGEKRLPASWRGCERSTRCGASGGARCGRVGGTEGRGVTGTGSPAIRGAMEAGCITSWGRYFRLGMSKNDKRLGK